MDISIPPPPGEASAAEAKPAASNPEGKALAAKLTAAQAQQAIDPVLKQIDKQTAPVPTHPGAKQGLGG